MSTFYFDNTNGIISGFRETDKGMTFQSQVRLADFENEEAAAEAAADLAAEHEASYEESVNGRA